ncbi:MULTISPECIES: TIGR00269 family protein [Methanobacterium]|uniref:TIGR00269 family protein n=1 Tax=Methanobacterium veterum TaxID=408577 RepID=A0A9E4ZVR7_9EURY|nr:MULTISPECIES: TIGR00269 family protein [Methanobacterium]MCZ3366154.1 TIGR00269 family protein [Methanobacterium veterum]MCZ3371618.1 TIGR00269 family protein [Methanobacterium veterum]
MVAQEEFNKNIENNVKETIETYGLLAHNEKVAVALSGGKDSILTLHILNKFKEEYNLDLVAITIDEGISGYRNEGVEAARKNAEEIGVKLIEKSFLDEFNFKLDDIFSFYKSACIPCGVFRRYLLNKTAYEVGACKIATGHNLDDEIQSFLMTFARADFRRFSKFGPKLNTIHEKLIPRIKPLWNVPEKDVGTWAVLNDIDVHFAECPYSHLSARSKIKGFLNKMESERKGTKVNILRSFDKTFQFEKKPANLYECKKCGEPSSMDICKACEMLEEINGYLDG